MSLLPNDTYVNSGRALWAVAGSGGGGGGGNTLTSPASITPDVGGNTLLSLTATGTGNTNIDMTAVGVNANASVFIESQQAIASLGLLGGSAFGSVINMTGITPGGKTTVIKQSGAAPYPFTMGAAPAQVGQSAFLAYDSSAGILTLGDGLPTGSVITNQPLRVQNSLVIQSNGVIGTIVNDIAFGGTLNLGSSAAAPSAVSITDGAVAVTGQLNVSSGVTVPNLTANGTVTVNGSATITGTATINEIVLTGSNSTISVPGQGGGGQPPVGLTISPTLTVIGNPRLADRVAGSYNGGMDGMNTYGAFIQSASQAEGIVGNTGAQIPAPSDNTPVPALGDQSLEGLWQVSLITTNASTDIYSKLAQITTQSYWNPATGWYGGSGGYSAAGGAEFRSGINPSNVIAAGQLWVTNSSGNNWTGMKVNFVQLTGVLPNWFYA